MHTLGTTRRQARAAMDNWLVWTSGRPDVHGIAIRRGPAGLAIACIAPLRALRTEATQRRAATHAMRRQWR